MIASEFTRQQRKYCTVLVEEGRSGTCKAEGILNFWELYARRHVVYRTREIKYLMLSLQHAVTTFCSLHSAGCTLQSFVAAAAALAWLTSHFDADIFILFVSTVSPSNLACGFPTSTTTSRPDCATVLDQFAFYFQKTSSLDALGHSSKWETLNLLLGRERPRRPTRRSKPAL